MASSLRWTSADLDALPDDGKRYEIIAGELYVSQQPHWQHQFVCLRIGGAFDAWDQQTGAGLALPAPGVIFDDDEDVAPDVVWVSKERFAAIVRDDGKLYGAPELVVEVLSPGTKNERRDREAKLKLYSRRGVREYWIADWRSRQVEVYRHDGTARAFVATYTATDTLTSPLLPGFRCPVGALFADPG